MKEADHDVLNVGGSVGAWVFPPPPVDILECIAP